MVDSNAKIKIVVVDDERPLLETFQRVLEKKGYDVTIFENPVEAVSHIKSNEPHLIITDLRMPGMDGIQFLNQVKQLRPSVPVVFITAYTTISTAVSAMELGASDYLRKPFGMNKIYELVERNLSLSKS